MSQLTMRSIGSAVGGNTESPVQINLSSLQRSTASNWNSEESMALAAACFLSDVPTSMRNV